MYFSSVVTWKSVVVQCVCVYSRCFHPILLLSTRSQYSSFPYSKQQQTCSVYPPTVPVVTHTASAKCRKELGAGPVTRNGKEK